ncbi:hypothetical protein [Thalassospira sp.]|uniref:hypothetical protein n=1 Tax=Thalassospira sp. TaxID=1912094 RepID=UPI003AA8EDBD
MSVRCKFRCTLVSQSLNGFAVHFDPVISGSPENDEFFKYTPTGELKIGPVRPDVAKGFSVGENYYLDISPAPG